MEQIFGKISRNFYILPGGYFISKFLRSLFPVNPNENNWRTISFRGIKMKVDLSKQMGKAIYWRGAHDWAPIFALEKQLKKGETFIDVGANQGEYSIWAGRKVGPSGQVVSFEPMKELFSQLQENIKLNPHFQTSITPIQLGLSDEPGELDLYTNPGQNEGTNTIFSSNQFNIPLGKISLDTLDNQIVKLGVQKLNMIKIDVEGAELQVLQGGKNTLETFRPKLLIEINREACKAGGYEAEDILIFLSNYGYSFYIIGLRGKLNPVKVLPEFCNILAIRD
jgi:FkbM family methyltransferase